MLTVSEDGIIIMFIRSDTIPAAGVCRTDGRTGRQTNREKRYKFAVRSINSVVLRQCVRTVDGS